MHEWPLLLFTICMQAAIGGMLTIWLFSLKFAKGEGKLNLIIPLVVISLLSVIGLAASFVHLGSPGNAFNTMRGISSSWMSREILFTGLFIAAACITTGLTIVQKKTNSILLLVSSIIGFVNIFTMAAAYSNTLVSGWSSLNTYTSFYGTALILGSVTAASLVVTTMSTKEDGKTIKGFIRLAFYISLVGVAIQLLGLAQYATSMPEVNIIMGTNALDSLNSFQETVALRWFIEILGIAVLGYLARPINKKVSFSFTYVALLAIVIGEGISRYVFYVLGS